MRHNDIEFRNLENGRAELVQWAGTTCHTLAWVELDSEGPYIKTIGSRFTECGEVDDLMHVAKYAMRSRQLDFDFNQKK